MAWCMIAWHEAIAEKAVGYEGKGGSGSDLTLLAKRLERAGPRYGSFNTCPRGGRGGGVTENLADPPGQWMFFSGDHGFARSEWDRAEISAVALFKKAEEWQIVSSGG